LLDLATSIIKLFTFIYQKGLNLPFSDFVIEFFNEMTSWIKLIIFMLIKVNRRFNSFMHSTTYTHELDWKSDQELIPGQMDFKEGVQLFKSNFINEGIEKIQSSAKNGNLKGAHQLGICHQKGIGVIKSNETAFNWFQLSSQFGCLDSYIEMGLMQVNREGIPQNYIECASKIIKGINVQNDQKNPFFSNDLKIRFEKRMIKSGRKEDVYQEGELTSTNEYFYGYQPEEHIQSNYNQFVQNLLENDYLEQFGQIQNQELDNTIQRIHTNDHANFVNYYSDEEENLSINQTDANPVPNYLFENDIDEDIELQQAVLESLNFS
jgi:hypothetical protein